MSTTLTNGRVTISGTYGVTVNRGDFNSEKLSQVFALEYDVPEGADTAAVIAQAEAEWVGLVEEAVKPAVLDGLMLTGTLVAASEGQVGVLLADLGVAVAAPSNVTQITQAPTAPSGGFPAGNPFQNTPPKASADRVATLPRVFVDFDGTGAPQEWIDQRPLKVDGTYKGGAADFKRTDGSKQVWINDKNGAAQSSVVDKLVEAGITV